MSTTKFGQGKEASEAEQAAVIFGNYTHDLAVPTPGPERNTSQPNLQNVQPPSGVTVNHKEGINCNTVISMLDKIRMQYESMFLAFKQTRVH